MHDPLIHTQDPLTEIFFLPCVACQENTFKPDPGPGQCFPCPPSSVAHSTGNHACTCTQRGQSWNWQTHRCEGKPPFLNSVLTISTIYFNSFTEPIFFFAILTYLNKTHRSRNGDPFFWYQENPEKNWKFSCSRLVINIRIYNL